MRKTIKNQIMKKPLFALAIIAFGIGIAIYTNARSYKEGMETNDALSSMMNNPEIKKMLDNPAVKSLIAGSTDTAAPAATAKTAPAATAPTSAPSTKPAESKKSTTTTTEPVPNEVAPQMK